MSAMGMLPSPDCSDEEVLAVAVQQYFRSEELVEARRMIEVGHTYEEAIAFLAESAEDDLRNSDERPYWFFTIPSGKVSIYRPGHCFPERPLYKLYAGYLATQAFPLPVTYQPVITAKADKQAGSKGRQLSFWDASEITDTVCSQDQEEARRKKTRPKKLTYLEQSIAKAYGQPQQGWVVKDRGLGYVLVPMRGSEGHMVTLIHLKSRREMASVIIQTVNHERIREWVTACVLLTDWNKGIKAILAEKQGKQKQSAWSRQLEAIWWQQKSVKRQLAFF
ncbi:MAG: hypothetical protein H0U76_22390 [Ktedonobacteraceae bacterium]|nr:hypothetical protein [Ktedonobacteraceae bacterium]